MSYDLYVIDPSIVDTSTHMEEQEDLPATSRAARVAAAISAHPILPAEVGSARGVPLAIGGDTVWITSPYPDAERVRSFTVAAAFEAGFAVHDPQIGLTFTPDRALPGAMTSSRHGALPVIVPGAIDGMVAALGIRDYLIIERGDQLYVQTRRIADAGFQVEHRAGSAHRHFSVMVVAATTVAAIMHAWVHGDRATLDTFAWEPVDLG